ncbi:unnamed protein product [Mesocestoides corti]|uniref:Uncharacterized protein n=1 Tax=Mesocestoides corti TaxID=53468 RepID=A0A0R3UDZ2_MESCO|nr:unnamed protein product [Mesocestoides corti]
MLQNLEAPAKDTRLVMNLQTAGPLGAHGLICMKGYQGNHLPFCAKYDGENCCSRRCGWSFGQPRFLPLSTRCAATSYPAENWIIRRCLRKEIKWPGTPSKANDTQESSGNNAQTKEALPEIRAILKTPDSIISLKSDEEVEKNNASTASDHLHVEVRVSPRYCSESQKLGNPLGTQGSQRTNVLRLVPSEKIQIPRVLRITNRDFMLTPKSADEEYSTNANLGEPEEDRVSREMEVQMGNLVLPCSSDGLVEKRASPLRAENREKRRLFEEYYPQTGSLRELDEGRKALRQFIQSISAKIKKLTQKSY